MVLLASYIKQKGTTQNRQEDLRSSLLYFSGREREEEEGRREREVCVALQGEAEESGKEVDRVAGKGREAVSPHATIFPLHAFMQ